MAQAFLLVPKSNILGSVLPVSSAAGAPAWLQEWIVSEDELKKNYVVPENSDFSAYFVVDSGAPRARLGKRVKSITFEETVSQVLTNKGINEQSSVALAPGQDDAEEEPSVVSAAVAPEPSAAAAPDTAKRSAASGAGTLALAEPSSKRQRALNMMKSDDGTQAPEEAEAAVLEDLINKLKKAARAKLFYSEDTSCATIVHFWCSQVVAAMQAESAAAAPASSAADAPGASVKMTLIRQHFPLYLIKLLYSNKCYSVFRHFVPLLAGLTQVGCEVPANVTALKTFAGVDLDSPTSVDLSSLTAADTLGDRLKFFSCPLYKDLVVFFVF